MKKGFGLINNYYFWIASMKLKQYSRECLNAVANSADVQCSAHVLKSFVVEASLVWRTRSTKANAELIALRRVNCKVKPYRIKNDFTETCAFFIVGKQPSEWCRGIFKSPRDWLLTRLIRLGPSKLRVQYLRYQDAN